MLIFFIWVAVILVALFFVAKLRRVWIPEKGIIIFYQTKELLVGWKNIERVYYYRARPEFVFLKLNKKANFGKSIVFLPELRFDLSNEHPIIYQLKCKIPYYQGWI